MERLGDMWTQIKGMFGALSIPAANTEALYYLRSYALLLLLACLGATPLLRDLANRLAVKASTKKTMYLLEPCFYVVLMVITTGYLVDSSFNPFLYFRF